MAQKGDRLMDRLLFRRSLRRWSALADDADGADPSVLRALRAQARGLRGQLDRLIRAADDRLGPSPGGMGAIRAPLGTDWSWRPDLWRCRTALPGQAGLPGKLPLREGATLFHDCPQGDLAWRQIRNTRPVDIAPFALRLEVFRFGGSFLSLVIDLPSRAAQGLGQRHILRLDLVVEVERPLPVFARLNIRQGPNVEQVVRQVPVGKDELLAEFDLAYTAMNDKPVDKLWLDLIFEGPEMNQITLRDATVSRRLRAAL